MEGSLLVADFVTILASLLTLVSIETPDGIVMIIKYLSIFSTSAVTLYTPQWAK